ncbi:MULTISPECIES: stage V sporulation protein T [Bacillaceae]|uniref:Stage V sporulation protein T n=1 Tax=Psychrobacillus mangrovi TaxID=3117745 RepID=A0ABU8F918_9BACI|nr:MULTISPECIES: stage V sporulation protein T [Bacillaceae]ALC88272.1 stage VI sporulation protein D [Bacillus sp. FJAT-22090]KQL32373.1 stage VI sporulation protein D [Psychrobacillus sp. FJAT-21963]MDF2065422.1 stage V sporulation protein T [Bacillus sp. Cr_A10]
MKATGIVRRIDDLGRVVIPKEIRRTLRIREGDPLEIFTDREGEVILKKYSPINELGDFAKEYAETLYETLGTPVLISDRDEMIAVAGLSKKDYLNRRLSPDVEEIVSKRSIVTEKHENSVEWVPGVFESVKSYCIAPIISSGDPIGAVFLISKVHFVGEAELKAVETAANFLAKQMET